MDDFTIHYLKQWGFDHLVDRFKEEEIDRMAFLDLTELMIATLIPKIGPQAKFFKSLQTLREEIQRDKNISSKESTSSLVYLYRDSVDENIPLNADSVDISTISNFEILNTEDNYNCLNDSEILPSNSQGIADVSIRSNTNLGIEIIFPTENKETYFIPREKENKTVTPNRGKLFDKYCNVKRKISKISNYKRKNPEPETESRLINLNEKDYADSINWLKNQVEPESILHKLWIETAPYRLTAQINENVMEIYPALKKPTGHFLIDLDFAHMYPKKKMSLFNKFETFKDKLKLYLNNSSINIGTQGSQLLTKLNDPTNNSKCDHDLAAVQLIPFLFPPVNIVLKNKKKIRPSKIEQSNAFIVNIRM